MDYSNQSLHQVSMIQRHNKFVKGFVFLSFENSDLGRFNPRTFHPRMVHPRTFHPRLLSESSHLKRHLIGSRQRSLQPVPCKVASFTERPK